jgi:hypothetical protein
MTSPTLPIAPLNYDQREERGFRGRVSLEIGKKLSTSELTTAFGGIPNAALRGTNAAFVVNATPATLPFNTVQTYDARLIVGTNFNLSYPMNVMVEMELFIAAAAAGAAQATLSLYAGATLLGSNTRPEASVTGETSYRSIIFSNMPPTQNITIKMSCTKNLTIDLTQSWLWILGLSGDPRLGT